MTDNTCLLYEGIRQAFFLCLLLSGLQGLQDSNQRINSIVAAMEIKLSNLSETVTELNQRLDQIS